MARRADRRRTGWWLALWALAAPAAPMADEATASVVLRWQPVAGAASYEIEVARDRGFADRVVVERVEVPGYRWRAIPEVRHYWRVRSLDASGRTGPWSEIKVIEAALVAPSPKEPAEGARFTWDRDGLAVAFAGAASEVLREYRLEVAADPAFSRPLLSRRGPSPSFRVELPGVGAFHWRLGGVALDGREAPWSKARTFTVELGAPRLLAPGPGAALPFGPVAINWETLAPAARWRVTVEREGAAPRQLEVAAPPLELAPERPGGYRVRVAAVLRDGRAGPASEAREFRLEPPAPLAAPRLAAPAAGAALDDPSRPVAFAWEPVPGAAGHELQVAPPEALEQAPVRPAAGAALEVTSLPPGPLAWRTRARDAFGGAGAWSEVRGLYLGPHPAARIEICLEDAALVADGESSTRLSIRLLDAAGRAVPGAPSVDASAGRVEGLAPAGDGWEARYVAPPQRPPGGAAEIGVRERDLTARARVDLAERPRRMSLGVLVGWRTNLARVSAPALGLEVLWRTPLLGERLLLGVRLSWYGESATIPPAPGMAAPLAASARVVPLAAVGLFEWPLGWATLYGGVSLGADMARLAVGQESAIAAGPAAGAILGATRRLGSGEALLEIAGSVGSVDSSLATLTTGGLSLSAGYRLRP
ncbi:MAG TPA: hypothetical protein VIV59_13485 [Anaeromyxobacteraceae bacterium]